MKSLIRLLVFLYTKSSPYSMMGLLVLSFILGSSSCSAQNTIADTVKPLSEVIVQAFGQKQNLTTALVSTIGSMPRSNKASLVSDVNIVPGIRMEERSPGSYRINIRGSSLRSPFGVRNVKVYWNHIPLTDPGGNTYFNQLAFNNFTSMEIFKGPASSMYGAGTGGLILLDNDVSKQEDLSAEYVMGSYGYQSVFGSGNFNSEKFFTKITVAHNQGKGYRQQSEMRRDNVSWINTFKVTPKQDLSTAILFTDMYYQTPGALTWKEYMHNPRAARPAAGIFPSAQEAKASIRQRNFTAGITYENRFNDNISNITTIYGAYSYIRNSAIRNYETRNEPHFGGRNIFEVYKKLKNGDDVKGTIGLEIQGGNFNIRVTGNNKGVPDTIQTIDEVHTLAYSLFAQTTYTSRNKWIYTAGISYNKSRLGFTRLSDYPIVKQPFSFSNEVAPRISISKKFHKSFTVLGSISKGYSPPTIGELLPSTGVINTVLKAEEGLNYELTAEKLLFRTFRIQATGFYFDMKNALVQQRDEAGADYFTNAGKMKQQGVEVFTDYEFRPAGLHWLTNGYVRGSYAFSHFRYTTFVKDGNDFSGKHIPGIPKNSFSVAVDVYCRNGLYVSTTYFDVSKMYMDDANVMTAQPYHLLSVKVGYKTVMNKIGLDLYTGAENLFNQTYSLGNDINAVGGRYYNAAPRRNIYAGAAIRYKR